MKKNEMREDDQLTDPLNSSVISLIEETNSNLVTMWNMTKEFQKI